jgi:hypothetical protein
MAFFSQARRRARQAGRGGDACLKMAVDIGFLAIANSGSAPPPT